MKNRKIYLSIIFVLLLILSSCDMSGTTNPGPHNHIYDNQCDSFCNECNEERPIEHVFDNDCDSICNICSYERNIEHSLERDDFDCTTAQKCTVCGVVLVPAKEHTFDGDNTKCSNEGCIYELRTYTRK